LEGVSHFLVAAILGHEFGIGVRNGCFCAHPYLLHLLGVKEEAAQKVRSDIIHGDRGNMPGMVRVSFGLYNNFLDIDRLISALEKIRSGSYHGKYLQNKSTGEFIPEGWSIEFDRFFTFK
ncbi:MAG: aminotransferase class V-fold PLP-dependent enzyme, partial [Bellilinea sp.]